MQTAVIWGYVLVSMSVSAPQTEPWVTFDYKTQESCESDRTALIGTVPDRQAWCIPVPKPEKAATKRVAQRRARVRH